jgi:hypothetical protein
MTRMSDNSNRLNSDKINSAIREYKKVYSSAEKIDKEKNVLVGVIKDSSSYKAMPDELRKPMAEQLREIESINFLANIFNVPKEDIVPMICKTDTMFQIIDSINYLRDKYCKLMNLMDKMSAQDLKIKPMKSMEILMKQTGNEFQATENMIIKSMDPDEVLNGISSYYSTLSEMEVDSKTFSDVVTVFSPLSDSIDELPKKPTGFWDRFMDLFSIIKQKIQDVKSRISSIVDKIKGSVSELGRSLLSSLDNIDETITEFVNEGVAGASKLKNKIIEGLKAASNKFQSLISKLIEKMFGFLSQFGELAKSKGFPVSKVELKVPTIKFEYTSIFGFSIPLPGLSAPEMTLTMTPA